MIMSLRGEIQVNGPGATKQGKKSDFFLGLNLKLI
jgi:hypothetical protein